MYRVMAGAVVVGGVAGLVANVASAVFYVQYSAVNDQAAAACDAAGNHPPKSRIFSASLLVKLLGTLGMRTVCIL